MYDLPRISLWPIGGEGLGLMLPLLGLDDERKPFTARVAAGAVLPGDGFRGSKSSCIVCPGVLGASLASQGIPTGGCLSHVKQTLCFMVLPRVSFGAGGNVPVSPHTPLTSCVSNSRGRLRGIYPVSMSFSLPEQ